MRFISSLLVIAAGSLWGTTGLWVHTLNELGLGAMDILAVRVSLAALIDSLLLIAYDRRLFKIRLKDIWCFISSGVLSVAFFGFCYNLTILLTSMSTAAVLLYTAPIFVMLLSRVLFGEALSLDKIVSLVLAFIGCALVTGVATGELKVSLLGLITGLCCGFGYALYSIFGRFALNRGYHPFTVTVYTFITASAAVLILADKEAVLRVCLSAPSHMALAAGYTVVTTVLPYIFYTLGLSGLENGRAAILATVEPVVATVLGTFVLKEPMYASQFIGVILVLGAISLPELMRGEAGK